MSNLRPDGFPEGARQSEASVMVCGEINAQELEGLFLDYGVEVEWVELGMSIPSSYWGDREAGLRNRTLFLRPDTPLHSALHEGCHIICAAAEGRCNLDTNAEGEQIEEDAVCFLQILLADRVPGFGKRRALMDMDAWGYSFRLGSAGAWFAEDAEDAEDWLLERGVATHAREAG